MNALYARRALAAGLCPFLTISLWLGFITHGTGAQGDAYDRIREEGMNRSQVMDTLAHLTEVIGPRLTASPAQKKASEWTRDKLTAWGCSKAELEAFGPFGRGWTLESFSAQVVAPQAIPLIAYPAAWSPGLPEPVTAPVVFLEPGDVTQLETWKGKLKGAFVLCSPVREVKARFEPLAWRLSETNLLRLANASPGSSGRQSPVSTRAGTNSPALAQPLNRVELNPTNILSVEHRVETNTARRASATAPARRSLSRDGILQFLEKEGAAAALFSSPIGDGGTIFVTAATVPRAPGVSITNAPRAWSTNAPPIVPQVTLATEDYNRLVRMCRAGEKLQVRLDLRVRFHDEDLMAYNTIAEIPGTDLKDEVVMVGGHLDSWHSSPGATDNAIGVAVSMEAMRIIKKLDLKPRRTIRIGLWAGEEQGLLGSRAYVAKHFGFWTNYTPSTTLRTPKDGGPMTTHARVAKTEFTTRKVHRTKAYENFSAYFNFDNGGGRIRGIYLQGNEAARPLFRSWFERFRDLEADTVSLANTGSTDHIPFDAIGLPGFQFIQDPLEYTTRTHHSNQDSYDRIQPEDAKQASVIMAACAYSAAMADEQVPRKPLKE